MESTKVRRFASKTLRTRSPRRCRATVRRYCEDETWWRSAQKSSEFRAYYRQQYGNR
jgi:hypothetical protein